jgi:hypothetical protein
VVNLLETLYVLVALDLIAAIVLAFRGRKELARRLGYAGAAGTVLAIAMYWYLSSA